MEQIVGAAKTQENLNTTHTKFPQLITTALCLIPLV